jgi:hypothetical protein
VRPFGCWTPLFTRVVFGREGIRKWACSFIDLLHRRSTHYIKSSSSSSVIAIVMPSDAVWSFSCTDDAQLSWARKRLVAALVEDLNVMLARSYMNTTMIAQAKEAPDDRLKRARRQLSYGLVSLDTDHYIDSTEASEIW